jgi:hypothetical protein
VAATQVEESTDGDHDPRHDDGRDDQISRRIRQGALPGGASGMCTLPDVKVTSVPDAARGQVSVGAQDWKSP